jgi:hypothetical protein
MQEMIVKFGFVHMVDAGEHSTALRPTTLKHHQGNAAAVLPVPAFAQKNPPQIRHGQLVHGVRHIDHYRQVPLCSGGLGNLSEPRRVTNERSPKQSRTDQDEQNMCPAQHLDRFLKT